MLRNVLPLQWDYDAPLLLAATHGRKTVGGVILFVFAFFANNKTQTKLDIN